MVDITADVARYSMEMASARTAQAIQTSMLKNVMEAQKDMMAQLLKSMGLGGSLDVRAEWMVDAGLGAVRRAAPNPA